MRLEAFAAVPEEAAFFTTLRKMSSLEGGGPHTRTMFTPDMPIVVSVALLPPRDDETRMDEPCNAQYLSSVSALTDQPTSVAEFARYLVEVACPEEWIMPICRRAAPENGIVKLTYGNGYETTVLLNDANAGDTPSRTLAVGVAVYRSSATPRQIGDVWTCASDTVWTHASFHAQRHNRDACVYIKTGNKHFVTPCLTQEELAKRRRTIRIWSSLVNENIVERMEEIRQGPPPMPRPPPPPRVLPPAPHAPVLIPVPPVPAAPPVAAAAAAAPVPPVAVAPAAALPVAAAPAAPVAADSEAASVASRTKPNKRKKKSGKLEKQPSKKKVKKDPTKPKKQMSLYNLFLKENRPRFAKENPEATFIQIVSIYFVKLVIEKNM